MDTDATATEKVDLPPGRKHWLFQTIPPLSMLFVFVMTTSGTLLVFLAGFLLLPVLISLISIIVKLIFFKKRKSYLVRPLLTVAIFVLILVIANWTYQIALDQAITEARVIHQQCNESLACPENLVGWQRNGPMIRKNDLGVWLKYMALYSYDKESFDIRVYQAPDIGDHITGGVDLPFRGEFW
jgi:hypothetical protein